MSRWQIALLAAAALLLAGSKIYDKGEAAGRAAVEARYAQQLRDAQDEVTAKNAAIQQIALHQLAADQQRQITHQEIVRESIKIMDRPIYRNQCIDADGLLSSTTLPPTPTPTASIPPHLMITPPTLPKLQRGIDDQGNEVMTGEQALNKIAMLYGAYGDVRATLVMLQEVMRIAQARVSD